MAEGGATPAGAGEPLLVADSWRVSDGAAVGLAEHRARFEASVAAAGAPAVDWPGFWRGVAAAVPRRGGWFPRVELPRSGGPPRVRLRPVPVRRATTALVWDGAPDPRRAPATKGPDLGLLAGLRAAAVRSGGDCALLVAPGGAVREAATGSLLWWEDDVLCTPADDAVLTGVTAGLVLARAAATGVRTDWRARRPEELAGREVWFTNALHGVTGVVALHLPSGPVPLAPPARAPTWHAVWAAAARPAAPAVDH